MKKKLICALMTAAMAGSLVSGLTVSADSDSQVTISLYTTLPNKDAQFAAADDAQTISGEDYRPQPSYTKKHNNHRSIRHS